MTGEITLRGRVLPNGGVREKALAAHRAGIKIVILPERNLKDLVDVPKQVQKDLKILPVSHMNMVLEIALSKLVVTARPLGSEFHCRNYSMASLLTLKFPPEN